MLVKNDFCGDKSEIDEEKKYSLKTRDRIFGASEVVEGSQTEDEEEKTN